MSEYLHGNTVSNVLTSEIRRQRVPEGMKIGSTPVFLVLYLSALKVLSHFPHAWEHFPCQHGIGRLDVGGFGGPQFLNNFAM